jgi:putative ABC transport system permease protein
MILLLNVATVALGVAVYLAIQIANHSAFRAFSAGIDVVAGMSHLEVRDGETGVDETLLPVVAGVSGVAAVTPVCEGYVILPDFPGEYLRVLGLDPFTGGGFQTAKLLPGEGFQPEAWLSERDCVFLSRRFADLLGLAKDQSLRVQIDGRTEAVRIGGLLEEEVGHADGAPPERVAAMDIGWFQELFRSQGRVSAIQIRLEDPTRIEAMLGTIQKGLTGTAVVEAPSRRAVQVQRMLEGFQLNITALSMVSILVGIFLIYNTVSASVVRRRREIGILRSVGASRRQVMGLFLGEGLLLGIVGTVLGIGLGILLGSALLGQVARTVSTHYILISIDRSFIDATHVGQAAAYGIMASILGAWMPAWEASRVDPVAVMHPGRMFETPRTRKWLWFGCGLACLGLVIVSARIALESGPPQWSFGTCFFLLAGFSLMTPLLSLGMAAGATRISSAFGAVLARIAGENFQRSLHRTAPTVAALMVSVAMVVGVSAMVASFRSSVDQWVGRAMVADLYVAPAANEILGMRAYMPEEVRAYLDGLAEVEETETYLESEIPLADGNLYPLAVVDSRNRGNIVYLDHDGAEDAYLGEDKVIVSENFSRRYGAKTGDVLELPAPGEAVAVTITGVFRDYSDDRGRIFMTRENYDRYWNDPRYHSLAVYLKPASKARALPMVEEIRARFGASGEFSIFTNASIREKIFDVFDQTFAITYVLRTIAVIVAVFGIVLTLTTLVMERGREIALLRALGAGRGQICRTYLTEAGLIGFFGSLLGLACGLLLAVILSRVVNVAFFRWTIDFSVPWAELLWVPIWVTMVALLAGLYPSLRAARREVAGALRVE